MQVGLQEKVQIIWLTWQAKIKGHGKNIFIQRRNYLWWDLFSDNNLRHHQIIFSLRLKNGGKFSNLDVKTTFMKGYLIEVVISPQDFFFLNHQNPLESMLNYSWNFHQKFIKKSFHMVTRLNNPKSMLLTTYVDKRRLGSLYNSQSLQQVDLL